MASEAEEADKDSWQDVNRPPPASNGNIGAREGGDEVASEEDEDDEEPRLKYASLTKHLKSVYRNGDATSAFLIAGDKMVSVWLALWVLSAIDRFSNRS